MIGLDPADLVVIAGHPRLRHRRRARPVDVTAAEDALAEAVAGPAAAGQGRAAGAAAAPH